MREKRRRRDNTQQEALLIYMHTHTPTHTHASHIRTRTDFSHATEPRTDTPSKIEASQSDGLLLPTNIPMIEVFRNQVPSQLANLP